ncbi:hypothetical protein CB1_000270003 [Camelus ferus]|nr:hypothetical protein CB1_000270003 [Camelus ferus]
MATGPSRCPPQRGEDYVPGNYWLRSGPSQLTGICINRWDVSPGDAPFERCPEGHGSTKERKTQLHRPWALTREPGPPPAPAFLHRRGPPPLSWGIIAWSPSGLPPEPRTAAGAAVTRPPSLPGSVGSSFSETERLTVERLRPVGDAEPGVDAGWCWPQQPGSEGPERQSPSLQNCPARSLSEGELLHPELRPWPATGPRSTAGLAPPAPPRAGAASTEDQTQSRPQAARGSVTSPSPSVAVALLP